MSNSPYRIQKLALEMVLPDRLARFLEPSFKLRYGEGNGVDENTIDVCAMQAADWLAGGNGKNDHPECVCPVIVAFLIRLNDSRLFCNHRDELKPVIPKILGTRASLAVMIERTNICAKHAAESTVKYAGYAIKYAPKYIEYADESAKNTAEAAKYAEYATEYTVKAAKYAAESIMHATQYAVESAESIAQIKRAIECAVKSNDYINKCLLYSADSAERAAEYTAELRKSCIECIKSMIEIV